MFLLRFLLSVMNIRVLCYVILLNACLLHYFTMMVFCVFVHDMYLYA